MERERTRSIQSFVIEHVGAESKGIARRVAEAYGISRQAANRHLDALVQAGVLEQEGLTRARIYSLRRTSALTREFRVTPVLNAERVWRDHAAPLLGDDAAAVRDGCRGAFRELVENVVQHARASWITFRLNTTARDLEVVVTDDGRGVFAALADKLGVASPREAAEELARRARARSATPPTARLVLLARDAERLTLVSSGWKLELDARGGAVSRDGDGRAGTSAAFRARRRLSPESRRDDVTRRLFGRRG